MIRLTLMRVTPSTSTLRELWDDGVPAVIGELRAAGYSVGEDSSYEAVRDDGWELRREHQSESLPGRRADLI